jgi:hypothetical protein
MSAASSISPRHHRSSPKKLGLITQCEENMADDCSVIRASVRRTWRVASFDTAVQIERNTLSSKKVSRAFGETFLIPFRSSEPNSEGSARLSESNHEGLDQGDGLELAAIGL